MRTRLYLIRSACPSKVFQQQTQQQINHDKHSRPRELHTGQCVMAKNYHQGHLWLPGVILQKVGPLTYSVQLDSGTIWRWHIDQLQPIGEEAGTNLFDSDHCLLPSSSDYREPQQPLLPQPEPSPPGPNASRYPSQNRHPPDCYSPSLQ